jgi:hypothetical protein
VWSVTDYDHIEAMLQHWQREPPVDILAAWWMGYKPPPKPSEIKSGREAIEELARMFPGGVLRG